MKNVLTSFLLLLAIAFASVSFATEEPVEKAADSVIYLFAHQDDEALIAAKIATDLRNGMNVYCIWITDGSGTANPEVREKESRDVMDFIGVPQENLYFLGYGDRYSWKSLDDVYTDVIALAGKIKPVEIMSNAYEGGNIDHDVASLTATLVTAKIDAVHYEFPLYNTYKGAYRVGKFLPSETSETQYTRLNKYLYNMKQDILGYYGSQAAIVQMLKGVIDLKSLKKNGEPYRIAPKHDYTQKPVDELLGYEVNVRNPASFDDWKGAVVPFLERMGKLDK